MEALLLARAADDDGGGEEGARELASQLLRRKAEVEKAERQRDKEVSSNLLSIRHNWCV